jgi:DNA ligase-1
MNFRPMLAAKFEDEMDIEPELMFLQYPLLASPKIDGIRFMKHPDLGVMSRSWKPLPNKMLQEYLSAPCFNYVDGEVVTGDDPAAQGLFNKTQSAIMTASDTRPFTIWIFDMWSEPLTRFDIRTQVASELVETVRSRGSLWVNYVKHSLLNNPEEVLAYEQEALSAGYEGIMLRRPDGPYKFGRSTLKQQGLIKVKRFTDSEAEVVGFEALERNTNVQVRDAFGLAKRSSHRSGKVPDNLLGRLLVRHSRYGDFAIGSGFDVDTRIQIWQNQEKYLGKQVTFKYQSHGTLDKPRTPIFKGFRPEVDNVK